MSSGTEDWAKSSWSAYNGNCLEWRFRRSSRSGGGNCTEAALRHGAVLVRDSKLGDASPILEFTPADWAKFTASIKSPPTPG